MIKKVLNCFALAASLLSLATAAYGQAPNLGTAANFVLFTTNGAVTNTGITHLTGHVGSNVGGSTGFGNVDGVMHDQDPASAQATIDLNVAYGELDAAIPTIFPALTFGNGQIFNEGVYSFAGDATLNLELNIDAQGNQDAVFIIQVEGTLNTNASSKVNLLNGAQACNVFWKVEGAVGMSAGTKMRGTIVAHNGAISMNAGDTLEGRALSINGAIGVNGIFAYTPLGCLAPILTGPNNPALATTECFLLFAGIGDVTNVGVSTVTGDVGSNDGLTTGYNPLLVTGNIHPIPDIATAQCASDLINVYNTIAALPYDIELLYPAQFGNNLVLTPHAYLMNAAVTFTDSLFLNAQGNADAVFIFHVNGAFGTSTYSKVVLTNGAQAKNVYWLINGAITISDYSIFNGTIISQGAINLMTGVTLYGRALTGVGAINTSAINAVMPTSCNSYSMVEPTNQTACEGTDALFLVAATGSNLNFQWRRGNVELLNTGNISGVNTSTLLISPVTSLDEAYNYNVIITGNSMPNDTSNYVSLFVETLPVITMEPVSISACLGDSISFSVSATGTALTYQWKRGLLDVVDGPTIIGANSTTLSIDPLSPLDTGSDYYIVISGSCLPNDTSAVVSLSLNAAPLIVSQPTDVNVCMSDSISFSVSAMGSALTYQWRRGNVNMVNGSTISGATSDVLSIFPTTTFDDGNNYNVLISGTCSTGLISDSVSLNFNNCFIDLSVVKTASSLTPRMGSEITFTIEASNLSNSNATLVEVNDILQSGYSYISSTTSTGVYSPLTGVWNVGSMNVSSVETLSITAVVMISGSYINEAIIVAFENDSIISNNISSIEPVPSEFFIPEGFSPNGDEINDLFVIRGILNFPSNEFRVFNRWGVLVFEGSSYANSWDGKSNSNLNVGGDTLPVGTYFYVLDLKDGSEVYHGTIYLNR
jgi:gliding motility-associated-like protein/uncharacterized repeat protein (TIGR01451 family)